MTYLTNRWTQKKRTHLLRSSVIASLTLSLAMPSFAGEEALTEFTTPNSGHIVADSATDSSQSSWLQVAERKARPGSGAYTRSDTSSDDKNLSESSNNIVKKKSKARIAKARPGSGARSRKKQTTDEAISSSGAQFASGNVKKRNSARPGSRGRKASKVTTPSFEKSSKESLAQTPSP